MPSDLPQILEQLPERIDRPSAWTAAEMRDNPEAWLYRLGEVEVAELETAANHFLELDIDLGRISRESFPLPGFGRHLSSLSGRLLQGRGVELIRGLPVDRWSRQFAATVFCGIGAHLGSARSQNAQGHILGHVRDTGADADDPGTRIYQTNARQTFHTDSTDVVGLLCLQPARKGGESLLVSAEAIYNRLRAERPDLLAVLLEPIATDRRGEIPAGAQPYMTIPPLSWHDNLLTVFYQRQYIDSAQRLPGVGRHTERQVSALDAFDALANDPELSFEMRLEAGDMQFVYNHALLHDRKAFTDWPEPERRRHLLRLWLSMPGDRALPECFRERYGSIEIGNRGGIVVDETKLNAPISALSSRANAGATTP